MSADDYAKRQGQRDADYERDYDAWVKSMTPDERKRAEELGVLKPCVQRHGSGAPDHDIADSPAASYTPDIAAMVDHEPDDTAPANDMGDATRILRHLVADIVAEDNTRLTIECLAIALGLRVYAGDSMTEIANRHGITRAAVSKRCVDIINRLNLQPSRAMRSKRARQTYRKAQIKRYRSNKL